MYLSGDAAKRGLCLCYGVTMEENHDDAESQKNVQIEKVKNKNMLSTILAICYCVLIEITLKLEAVETLFSAV